MMDMLRRVEVKGFKSLREVAVDLGPLNVLIGANGSGKSNLIGFFKMVSSMMEGRLQNHVKTSGFANSILSCGVKATPKIEATLELTLGGRGNVGRKGVYHFVLAHAPEDTLVVMEETVHVQRLGHKKGYEGYEVGSGDREVGLADLGNIGTASARRIANFLKGICYYQFHDTSATSPMRLSCDVNDNRVLHSDGGNLAAILYKLKQSKPNHYERILGASRQIAPFFEGFRLAPAELNRDCIQLRWQEWEKRYEFGAHLLPDGLLRAIALVTLLLQPEEDLPNLLLIDEPELGLHPLALSVVSALLRTVSMKRQVLIATHSTDLVDQCQPEDIVVSERDMGDSVFHRLNARELKEWLQEYSLSQLWNKNVFGGRPSW